ncbi:MAG: protein BatD [Candidatus Omnitrophica bacterium]|nr:protein BatD [Candidatus Omnitrophota bacterium]
MNRLLFFTVFVGVFFLTRVAFSDEPQLAATLDKQTTRVNEEIHLNVKISGVRGSLQAPHVPPLNGFEVFYSGRSSRFSFINGRSESLTEFNYVLIPRNPGRFLLQPIEVTIGDQVYRTNQLQIQVEDGQRVPVPTTPPPFLQRASRPTTATSAQGPSYPTSAPPLPQSQQNQSPAISDRELDENIFLRVVPSQLTVYQNQQLILTYSLYTRYDTRYEGFVEEPETSGFWIEEFPMDPNLGRDTEVLKGKKYVRADVKKLALFPTAPGQYQIKPGIAKTSVQIEQRPSSLFDEFFNDSFFTGSGLFARRVEKILAPPAVQVVVKPLPEVGKPSGFKGAVGDFRMATSIDKRTINQNEAVTLQISLEGEGNIETLERPVLSEIKDTKIYEADTQTQLFRAQNVIAGKKTFEVVLIPSEAGELVIPSVGFSFFNPKIERYVTLKSDAYKVKVNPSKNPPAALPKELLRGELGEGKKSIRLESEDIQYIKERLPVREKPFLFALIFGLGIVNTALTLSSIGIVAYRKRSEYLDQNISLKRKLFAKRYATQGLKKLDRLMKSSGAKGQTDETFFEESAKILSQYLADRFNLSAHGLTQDLIERKMESHGLTAEVLQKVRICYETCDQVRFGHIGLSEADREAMVRQIRVIIYELEK